MDLVIAAGVLAIGLIVLLGFRSLRKEAVLEDKAAADLARTEELGIQPSSLYPKVNLDICIGTGACIKACPEIDVLGLVDGKARLTNPTSCIGHGECMRACPVDAIELVIGTEHRGIDIPLLATDFQSNVPGLYIVGELGGMGLVYNAMTQALQCMTSIRKNAPPKVEGIHQVVIIGAGPAGLAASLSALEAKLDFVTLDQDSMGGTVLQYPRHKIVMSRPVDLPLYGKLKVTSVKKEDLLEKWEDILNRTGLEIRTPVRVESVTKGADGAFDIESTGGKLRAQRVVLALGRRGTPRKLDVPGEDLPKVTYRLLEPEAYAGKTCLVVGGGDSAVEAAVALAEAGATVHLSYRSTAFSRIKPKNQERIDEAMGSGRVSVLFESNVKSIQPETVSLEVKGTQQQLANDYVLVFAGGLLPTAFLEKAGVEVKTFKGEAFAPANR